MSEQDIYNTTRTLIPGLTFSSVHHAPRRESWRFRVPWKRNESSLERNCQLSETRKKGGRIWGEANTHESMFTIEKMSDYANNNEREFLYEKKG